MEFFMKFTINLPKKTSSNNGLSKKETIRKKNNKEIKIEKPITSFSINHDSLV